MKHRTAMRTQTFRLCVCVSVSALCSFITRSCGWISRSACYSEHRSYFWTKCSTNGYTEVTCANLLPESLKKCYMQILFAQNRTLIDWSKYVTKTWEFAANKKYMCRDDWCWHENYNREQQQRCLYHDLHNSPTLAVIIRRSITHFELSVVD